MGILSNIRSSLKERKQKRINDEEIKRVINGLKEADSDQITDEESKNLRRQYWVTELAIKVKSGEVKFEDSKGKDPLEVVESILEPLYPQIKDVGKEIRFTQMFREISDIIEECIMRMGVHKENYDRIEKLAIDFYKQYPDDKTRNFNMNPLSDMEIHNIICSYYKKGIDNEEVLEEILKRMEIFTANKVIEKIRNNPSKIEQERMYEEYVRDFLGGVEDSEEYFVSFFEESEFIQKRNLRKKCEEYGVEYDKEPLIIYEADESKEKELDEKNIDRIYERRGESSNVSDLILVRTTNAYPKNGIVEILDKHIMPEYQESFFRKEIEKSGLDLKDFDMYSFMSRRTSHWTLNGLVSSHMYGNFEGRNFIITEPFEKQVNHDGLLNIDEADTYFNGDLKLSDKAIVLMKLEEYKERFKDPAKREEMKNMNIRLFVGDEKIAVKMLLQDLGYVYEEIGMWGYDLGEEKPEDKYARKLEAVMQAETERLQKEGKNIKPGTHFYSETREIDLRRNFELENEKLDRFVEMLFQYSDVNFSPKYLKRVFINRMSYKEDDEDHYLDSNIEEPEGLVKMGPQEVFDKIGPEKIKEITKKYNEMILEEHKIAREKKDEELAKKGWIEKEETKGQEVID